LQNGEEEDRLPLAGAKEWAQQGGRTSAVAQVLPRCQLFFCGPSARAVPPAWAAWWGPVQVLETGIALHSVLIGVALGVSSSPCTIQPLLAALTFSCADPLSLHHLLDNLFLRYRSTLWLNG
jgi:hypothetical protein